MESWKYLAYLSILFTVFFSCKNIDEQKELKEIDSLTTKINWILDKDNISAKTLSDLHKLVYKNHKKLSLKTRFKTLQNTYLYYTYKDIKLEIALNYCDSMINLMINAPKTQDNIRELAGSYNSKGDILYQMKAFEEAYSNFLRAKELNLYGQDKCMNSNYSDRMALILFKQKKYKKAGDYFRQSLNEIQSCDLVFGEKYRIQGLYNNIALCFGRSAQPDSAIVYYNKALAFINENDTLPGKRKHYDIARAVVYGNLGGEYLIKKQYSKARELLEQSIRVNSQEGYDQKDAMTAYIKLIRLYLETEHLKPVENLLKSLKQLNDKYDKLEYKKDYHLYNAKYLKEIHLFKAANDELEQYIKTKELIDNESITISQINVDERLRSARSRNEINQLKEVSENQQKFIYSLFAVAIAVIIVLILIFIMWRISRKNYKKLNVLKEELQKRTVQLEHTLADLDYSHIQKDKILRTVAHDLRNPIGGISSLVAIIKSENNEGENSDLDLIEKASNEALILIDELMEVSDIHNDSCLKADFKKTELNGLTKSSVELLKFKAKEKSILLEFHTTDDKLLVDINQAKISRVIANLITNAIKFSEIGGAILVSINRQENEAIVSIADNGIGISADVKDSIFEIFTSYRRVGTNGEKSFGLGLSICKQIVEAHGGKIWYHANEPKGTVFSFSLPLAG